VILSFLWRDRLNKERDKQDTQIMWKEVEGTESNRREIENRKSKVKRKVDNRDENRNENRKSKIEKSK
jgi:hypothetical protein